MVTFFKRDAKISLNSVNSGNLQYVAATPGDYDLYEVGQSIQIQDHLGNPVLDGYVKEKSRSKGVFVNLYVEDAGQFLRDTNVEDNAPEDGEPVFDSIRNIIQDYIIPASWTLDTSALTDDTFLDRPVGYAVRNGTALKHINSLMDMLSLRWVADWSHSLSIFKLHLYPLVPPTYVDSSDHDLTEYGSTAAFSGGDSTRHFITQIQVVGGEAEVSQKITYLQADTTEFGYLETSDTYCQSVDLAAATTIVDVMHGSLLTGWATTDSTLVKFNHDDSVYQYGYYDGVSIREIVAYPDYPWKYVDPATVRTTGLSITHGINDEMYQVGQFIVDRELPFIVASVNTTNMLWVGSEVVKFESATFDSGKTRFYNITRGVNGVRYVHRPGTRVRPYYPASIGAIVYPDAPLFRNGAMSTSISVSGFVELDGLDKMADGILKAASLMYTGSTDKFVATLDSTLFYAGRWVNTTPASVLQTGTTTAGVSDVPPISLVKGVSYSFGGLVKVEFGTNIPTIVRNQKESVTAFDLVMQKPRLSQDGQIIQYSDNNVAVQMKFSKDTAQRIRSGDSFDESDDTNYTTKWVRVK